MDLVPDLEEAVRGHLADLGFDVRSISEPGSGVDLVLTHPSTRVALGVAVMATLPSHGQVKLPAGKVVVAAPNVSPQQGARLRAAGAVGFIDAAGNASIEVDGLYVHVEGRPPTLLSRAARLEASRGWSSRPTGLQVLLSLLTHPELLDARLADVAAMADVSVATAHRVLADLTGQGVIEGRGGSRRWLDRAGAVRAWIEGYTRTVAPRAKESAYVTDVPPTEWESRITAAGVPAWVTGGAALAVLGSGLRPVSATVYQPHTLRGAPTGARLARPRAGETPTLFIREASWHPDAYPPGLAPELLVYADAMSSGDPRVISSAAEVMRDVPDLRDALAPR